MSRIFPLSGPAASSLQSDRFLRGYSQRSSPLRPFVRSLRYQTTALVIPCQYLPLQRLASRSVSRALVPWATVPASKSFVNIFMVARCIIHSRRLEMCGGAPITNQKTSRSRGHTNSDVWWLEDRWESLMTIQWISLGLLFEIWTA